MAGLTKWRSGSDYVGRLWPNGEFGMGRQKLVPMGQRFEPLGYQAFENPLSRENLAYACRMALCQAWCDKTGNSLPALGLSPHVKSHTRVKRGCKGISSYGRKMVRNGAYLLQKRHGKALLSFLTLTLPSVSKAEGDLLAREWSEVVRRFVQRLSRKLKAQALPGQIVGVTEIQEKRTNETGVLGLHLHMVFQGRHRHQGWAYSWLDYRDMWKIEIDRVLGRDVDCSAVENVESIKKDAEQYLGKYMSKGAKCLQGLIEAGWEELVPSAWWIMSNYVKRWIGQEKRYLEGSSAEFLIRICEETMKDGEDIQQIFLYVKEVVINMKSGDMRKIGWFGKICRPWVRYFYS